MQASQSVGRADPGDGRPDLDSPSVWTGLIESVGPASLLVFIETRMSAALQAQVAPEDILQDAMLHAWRDRAKCEWRGLRSFRAWLMAIITNRIRDAVTYAGAQKRGGDQPPIPVSAFGGSASWQTSDDDVPVAISSTTPSRVASLKEQAAAMREALESLPPDTRVIVQLRVFEQLSIAEIASRIGLPLSTTRHRLRKGGLEYRRLLLATLTSRAARMLADGTDASAADSSLRHRKAPHEADDDESAR